MHDLPFFFKSVLNALKENSDESLKRRKSDFYFHYTSLLAFQKIIEEKEIHFSDSKYLNDRSELNHGKKLIKDIIEKEKLNPISPEKNEKLDRLLKLV